MAWCVNHDFPFSVLRPSAPIEGWRKYLTLRGILNKLSLTEKTLFPSEWYSQFSDKDTFVVLHLSGERRLYGWPHQYPDIPTEGHFVIKNAEWLLDDGSRAPLHTVDSILIKSQDVEWVEFLKYIEEVHASNDEINQSEKLLVAAQDCLTTKDECDADESTETATSDAATT